jgi:hypothetical protein
MLSVFRPSFEVVKEGRKFKIKQHSPFLQCSQVATERKSANPFLIYMF